MKTAAIIIVCNGEKFITKQLDNIYDTVDEIIIADNGPGFIDPPERMVEPFWSRKGEGMGLGLYLAKQIMESHDGKLEFPDSDEVDLYKGINKAIVALVFNKEA